MMSGDQLKAHLHALTVQISGRILDDLNAVPENDASHSPGGCARSACEVVAECAYVNYRIAVYLETGVAPVRLTGEERAAHLRLFDTCESARKYFQQETDRLIAAIDHLDGNILSEISTDLMGRPMTRFAEAEFPAIHMMYHDGQINYLHTLRGDAEMYWNR